MPTGPKGTLTRFVVRVVFAIALAISVVPSRRSSAQTPSPFLVSPYFGQETILQYFDPVDHPGLDFDSMDYDRVFVAADGNVERVDWFSDLQTCHQSDTDEACGYGLYIRVGHANSYKTLYAHLSATAYPRGPVGLPVRQGQIIGTSGHTGWSTGPHLHFEVRHNGVPEDPFNEDGVSLWLDGWLDHPSGTPNPSRPIPEPVNGGEIILDDSPDNLAGFSKGSGGLFNGVCIGNCGGWIGSATGHENDSYFTPADGNTVVDNWARWQPQGLPTGQVGTPYEVYVHVPNVGTRTWQAPYTLVDSSGATLTNGVVDQYGLPNLGFEWVSLGIRPIQDGSYLYTTDATGEAQGTHCGAGLWCDLTVDAVKVVRRGTTYLPDIRTTGGWSTTIVVRNNGAGDARIRIAFYNNSAFACALNRLYLARHGTWEVPLIPCTANTAILDSDQNTSALALDTKTGGLDADNGFLPSGFGDKAFENIGGSQYVPAFYRNFDNWNSTVQIQNTKAVTSSATLQFYGRSGYCDQTLSASIPPYSRHTLSASQACSNPWVGSLIISGGQQLAAQVTDAHVDQGTRTSNATVYGLWGTISLHAPAAYRNWNGLNSSIVVQNLQGQSGGVDLRFYNRDGMLTATYTIPSLPSFRAEEVYLYDVPGIPDGWSGSVHIDGQGKRIAVRVSTTHSSGGRDAYSASLLVSNNIYLTRASKNASGLTTSYIIRNVGGGTLTVTATYYDNLGNVAYTTTLPDLPALGSAEYSQANDPLPDGWTGSIWLSASSASLVAMVRIDSSNASGAYNGTIPCSSSIYGQCNSVGE